VTGTEWAAHLTLTVETARVTKREIAFRVAVAASSENGGWLKKANGAWVTDGMGARYELSKERPGPGDHRLGSSSASYSHRLMPTETYRFELAFPPVSEVAPHIHLKHPDFPMLRLSWASTSSQNETPSV
jgi:hypothetical protein